MLGRKNERNLNARRLDLSRLRIQIPVPEDGSLRVWWIPQVLGEPFWWPVADLKQAATLLDALAAYDDFQLAHRVKGDYANAGGLCVFENGEWNDRESDFGDDLDTHRRSMREAEEVSSPAP